MTNASRRLVVLTTYPSLDASRRLRVDPLVAELRSNGWEVVVHTLVPEWLYQRKNDSGFWRILGAARLIIASMRRVAVIAALGASDAVLVHREAFPFFTPMFEKWAARRATLLVMDVDDAIHTVPTHTRDWRRHLRNPSKTKQVFCECDLVFAGSPMMRDLALSSGARRAILSPTVPPLEAFQLPVQAPRERRLLWTGSQSTLGSLLGVLDDVLIACEAADYRLAVLGGANVLSLPSHPHLEARRWSLKDELVELGRCSVGLMPLPFGSEWERGKSAYKAMLYMASGIVPVVSSVGMNAWLAESCSAVRQVARDESWAQALHETFADPALHRRRRICRDWAEENLRRRSLPGYQVGELDAAFGIRGQ